MLFSWTPSTTVPEADPFEVVHVTRHPEESMTEMLVVPRDTCVPALARSRSRWRRVALRREVATVPQSICADGGIWPRASRTIAPPNDGGGFVHTCAPPRSIVNPCRRAAV